MDVTKDIDFVRTVVLDNIENTDIRHSELHGFGLFCHAHNIECGSLLCVLDGQILTVDKYNELESKLAPKIPNYKNYFFMECNYLGKNELLVRPLRTKYSYINHSRTPNIALHYDPLRLIALRDIRVDDELTIDYRKESLPESYVSNPEKDFL
ncbi:SET domain-containing protein-lysine N-methyltransferase [Shewanella sp. MBTL60-007]|uniref:SET domain-containing protein-lysine N-methyltransferase n=1 Tax=Shewanella sp. MBTL60-007 TaxID=2815911 RepID=UPI001BBAFEBF|nr:SET domain-containing protein [Shewanella sp. MBTL60-007]GIU17877.1 hypothetical protein TUM3792_13300 [Shewanella sp. MBTL60-007]